MPEDHEGNGLRVAVHASPEALSEPWDRLADRLAVPPFFRPGWILAWACAFAPGKLSALTVTRDGELVGVLPLIVRGGVLAGPTNWHTPVFGFLAADREVSAELAERLVSQARVRADLSFLDPSDPNLAECRAAADRSRCSVIVRAVMRSPYIELSGTDWDSYRASLERKRRKDLERRRRRLDEEGSVSLDFSPGQTDLERLLEEGFALEGSGWKDERSSAIRSDPTTHGFYTEIARWASARGWLRMAFLRLDGRPIAFDLCLEAGGATYVLKGGFDPEFRRFAPGMLLTYESLRRGFEQGLSSYELLGDDDPYKLGWTPTVRERVRFQAFSRSPRGWSSHLAWSHGRAVARRALEVGRRSGLRRGSGLKAMMA